MTIILHNPLSRNRKSKRVTKKLVDYFKKNNLPFRVKSLLKIKDLEQYIIDKPEDYEFIVLGGDGTINAFVNQTYNLPIKHTIYLKQSGSGNDFLRSIKTQKPAHQYVMKLRHNKEVHYFINGAGMGIDGLIGNYVNLSTRKNKFNYFLNTLKAFLRFKPQYMEATIDGTLHKFKKAFLITVNNGAYMGGGMKFTPKAKLEENMLDVIVVHRLNKPLLFLIFMSVYFGLHIHMKPFVFYTKAKHVQATMFSAQISQCDGETFEGTQEIEVSLTNKILHFKPYKK